MTVILKSVKKHSFFDTFPSFSDWCSVRGSSKITFTSQEEEEGQQGSIAKRWSRRTGASVEGKIESRGVGLIYPVGGKPGARAKIATTQSARIAKQQVGKGLKRATGRDE